MRKKLILLSIVLALAAAATATCSPFYVLRAGVEEAKILSRRRPIADMIRDPSTSEQVRRKLDLVLQARTFAGERLNLRAGDSYTSYSWVDRDTLALVLSAARKDRFQAYTWWFPIVGHVPYKGFFSLDAARRAAEDLERKGYDTYIRPTSAFSTLGWFPDPLLSTLLRYSDVDLVSTVIHEITHNTVFVPSHVSFNESFASFVGDRGAIEFLCGIEGEDGERCAEARRQWADNVVFGRFLEGLIADLEAVYARHDLTTQQRIARRDEVYARARDRFVREVQPRLSNPGYRSFANLRPNNARLIAIRLYYDRLWLFDEVLERHGGDLPATIRAIRTALADTDADPFEVLRRLAHGPTTTTPPGTGE